MSELAAFHSTMLLLRVRTICASFIIGVRNAVYESSVATGHARSLHVQEICSVSSWLWSFLCR